MSIEKMTLVHIIGKEKSLDEALLRCVRSGLFHPENVYLNPEEKIFARQAEANPYTAVYREAETLLETLGIPENYKENPRKKMPYDELEETIHHLCDTVLSKAKEKKQTQDTIRLQEETLLNIKHMTGLNAQIEDMFTSQHSAARFGRMPVDNLVKLEYFKEKTFFFYPFNQDKDYVWGVYLMPRRCEKEIDDIFKTLYFERIEIPDYICGTPDHAVENLSDQIRQNYARLYQIEADLTKAKAENQEKIQYAYTQIKILHDTFLYRKYAVVGHKKFRLVGFVLEDKREEFQKLFEDIDTVVCEEQPADIDDHYAPPVKLKTNRLFRPFEMFVETYGLPSYHDFNPTTYVGIIYTLLFGIMFGDFGQGICVILVGMLIWKLKKMKLGLILTRCGVASMFFGFLYGSCFGFENNFQPVFKWLGLYPLFPLDVLDSQVSVVLLSLSLGVGICIILFSMLINIVMGLRKKDFGSALFSSNGIAGLIFYSGIIIAALVLLLLQINLFNPLFLILVVILPLLLIFFHQPLGRLFKRRQNRQKEKFSVMDSIFEMVDVLLSYCTNTLSFLRVGGFILSHAALMLVVMQFAHMAGSFGSPIVVVLGNAFVMGLEGLIVSIQVLRLIYYETFSRFYTSDGKPFLPAKIEFEQAKTR